MTHPPQYECLEPPMPCCPHCGLATAYHRYTVTPNAWLLTAQAWACWFCKRTWLEYPH